MLHERDSLEGARGVLSPAKVFRRLTTSRLSEVSRKHDLFSGSVYASIRLTSRINVSIATDRQLRTNVMKMLKLPNVVKAMAASTVMVAASAGATPMLADQERSLEQIICGLYRVESTSCRQTFDGGDHAQSQLWQPAVLEGADRADELFSEGRSVPRSFGARGASFGHYVTAGSDNTLVSPMSLNGGHDTMVAFRGDDDSILIGHYRSGPWSKTQFLLGWNDGRHPVGDGDPLPPIIEPSSGLPEPSTLALLGLGLLGVGVLRRQKKS
jgi:hypothetical protein